MVVGISYGCSGDVFGYGGCGYVGCEVEYDVELVFGVIGVQGLQGQVVVEQQVMVDLGGDFVVFDFGGEVVLFVVEYSDDLGFVVGCDVVKLVVEMGLYMVGVVDEVVYCVVVVLVVVVLQVLWQVLVVQCCEGLDVVGFEVVY